VICLPRGGTPGYNDHVIGSLLSVFEVARILGLAPRTLYRRDWQRRARLEPVKVGRAVRFRVDDVVRLIARQRHCDEPPSIDASARDWARRHGIAWPENGAGSG